MKSLIGLLIAGALVMGSGTQVSAQATNEESSNYKLTANDLLDFRVFQEPELDAVVRISGDGTATFPLVGNVTIGGKTISEAIDILKSRYKDGYLVSPQVNLTVRAYAKQRFTVLGQVQKPGAYEMQGTESVSLLQAIGLAGGYTRIADPANITVKRRESDGKERVIRFNAKRMARGGDDASFMLKAGDVVTVGESLF
ncbi:polysaccharide export outer membrane protein [Terrimicrobium sacchariphilum]|jgi:polysaccharide export outer membrane protein|uniref:Polysaccharide export outer membrane protein n=1 Tax=Terrimicrobium sacchariphilum TaxID=690879 RepID=A0A146GDX8_TERSA|nr:polysaccharide biosynthesis/export family protein [Terrimicrobium sacchariphilum]GAT34904.1 polysaccharide export outer membrane protein [Terrimicrobium sacchariphilum]